MEIIKNYSLNQSEFTKNLKVSDYFDYIYSYPPKIKIKWDDIDELNGDLLVGQNYGTLQHSAPFIDFIEDWFFHSVPKDATTEEYSISQYSDGFLDKLNSSNFFLKKTKKVQAELAKIPIFVIVNGHGEIVLNKPSKVISSKSPTAFLNERVYDSCGAFDPIVEKKSQLGLFFLNLLDAENYLKEIARLDFEGTQVAGLALNCIGLDSAYKISREHHPGVDFRFVPNFKEVKELLLNDIGKSDMIVEDEQQQLRFRRRNVNMFSYLQKLGTWLSPTSSFLVRNEYFKGVPVYVVQVTENPRNFWVERYFNIAGVLDVFYSRIIQGLDHSIGFGHNWIMQGSLKDAGSSERFENYIFFEKKQALKFIRKNGQKIARYHGSRTSNLEFMIRKPKIMVYNLEDLLEDWEDTLVRESTFNSSKDNVKTIFNARSSNFIPPTTDSEIITASNRNIKSNPVKDLSQSLNVKFRVFSRAVGVFFSL